MKARSLREGFDTDERIATLSPLAELLFRRLIGHADDHGRIQAHPGILCGRFAASRRPPTLGEVVEALDELGARLLRRYAKRGMQYAEIVGWTDEECPWHQVITRTARPLYPGPDDPEPAQQDLPLGAEAEPSVPKPDAMPATEAGYGEGAAPGGGHPSPGGGPGAGAGRADASERPAPGKVLGTPAPQALAAFAEAAGPRWAPGRAQATATGLAHKHEQAWVQAWAEARAAGYEVEDLRRLGRMIRAGDAWKTGRPLSPGALAKNLLDLLAESVPGTSRERGPVRGTRNRPTWRHPKEEAAT